MLQGHSGHLILPHFSNQGDPVAVWSPLISPSDPCSAGLALSPSHPACWAHPCSHCLVCFPLPCQASVHRMAASAGHPLINGTLTVGVSIPRKVPEASSAVMTVLEGLHERLQRRHCVASHDCTKNASITKSSWTWECTPGIPALSFRGAWATCGDLTSKNKGKGELERWLSS